MEWVQGESLTKFVSGHLRQPQMLQSLAEGLVDMSRSLQGAGIAHGDLQHGNILVVGGQVRLIDYDGMYVPALNGQVSHEVGHPNYQHPARKEGDFGPALDNFSVWVIHLSLLALGAQPSLWGQFQGGDECLLFRRKDFENPGASPVFRALEQSPDPVIQACAAMFKSLLWLAPLQIPLIDTHPPRGAATSQAPAQGWLQDHVRGAQPTGTAVPRASPVRPREPEAIGSTWILGAWRPTAQPLPALCFSNSATGERVVLAVSSLITASVAALCLTGVLPWAVGIAGILLLFIANIAFLYYRYSRDRVLEQIAQLGRDIGTATSSIHTRQQTIEL
jgi:hypothetical protein